MNAIQLTSTSKKAIFSEVKIQLSRQGFSIAAIDANRPWGGFFHIKETQIKRFLEIYFTDYTLLDLKKNQKVSPKILVIMPGKKLSWQYHFRRSELWHIVYGEVGIVKSMNDREVELIIHKPGDTVTIDVEERHRLVGLDTAGLVAEIWKHIDVQNPSNEEDIIRLKDDYCRG